MVVDVSVPSATDIASAIASAIAHLFFIPIIALFVTVASVVISIVEFAYAMLISLLTYLPRLEGDNTENPVTQSQTSEDTALYEMQQVISEGLQDIVLLLLMFGILLILFLRVFDIGFNIKSLQNQSNVKLIYAPIFVLLWIPIANITILTVESIVSFVSGSLSVDVNSIQESEELVDGDGEVTIVGAFDDILDAELSASSMISLATSNPINTILQSVFVFFFGVFMLPVILIAMLLGILRVILIYMTYMLGPFGILLWSINIKGISDIGDKILKYYFMLAAMPIFVVLLDSLMPLIVLSAEQGLMATIDEVVGTNPLASFGIETSDFVRSLLVSGSIVVIGFAPWLLVWSSRKVKGAALAASGAGALAAGAASYAGAQRLQGSPKTLYGVKKSDTYSIQNAKNTAVNTKEKIDETVGKTGAELSRKARDASLSAGKFYEVAEEEGIREATGRSMEKAKDYESYVKSAEKATKGIAGKSIAAVDKGISEAEKTEIGQSVLNASGMRETRELISKTREGIQKEQKAEKHLQHRRLEKEEEGLEDDLAEEMAVDGMTGNDVDLYERSMASELAKDKRLRNRYIEGASDLDKERFKEKYMDDNNNLTEEGRERLGISMMDTMYNNSSEEIDDMFDDDGRMRRALHTSAKDGFAFENMYDLLDEADMTEREFNERYDNKEGMFEYLIEGNNGEINPISVERKDLIDEDNMNIIPDLNDTEDPDLNKVVGNLERETVETLTDFNDTRLQDITERTDEGIQKIVDPKELDENDISMDRVLRKLEENNVKEFDEKTRRNIVSEFDDAESLFEIDENYSADEIKQKIGNNTDIKEEDLKDGFEKAVNERKEQVRNSMEEIEETLQEISAENVEELREEYKLDDRELENLSNSIMETVDVKSDVVEKSNAERSIQFDDNELEIDISALEDTPEFNSDLSVEEVVKDKFNNLSVDDDEPTLNIDGESIISEIEYEIGEDLDMIKQRAGRENVENDEIIKEIADDINVKPITLNELEVDTINGQINEEYEKSVLEEKIRDKSLGKEVEIDFDSIDTTPLQDEVYREKIGKASDLELDDKAFNFVLETSPNEVNEEVRTIIEDMEEKTVENIEENIDIVDIINDVSDSGIDMEHLPEEDRDKVREVYEEDLEKYKESIEGYSLFQDN